MIIVMKYINELVNVTNLKDFINVYSKKIGHCINLTLNKITKDYPDNWKKEFDGTDFSSEKDLTNKLSMVYNAIHYVTNKCPNEFRKYEDVDGNITDIRKIIEKMHIQVEAIKQPNNMNYKDEIKTKVIDPLVQILYGQREYFNIKIKNEELKQEELRSDKLRRKELKEEELRVNYLENNNLTFVNNLNPKEATRKEEGIFDDKKLTQLKQLQDAQIVDGFKLDFEHLKKLLRINDRDRGYQYNYTGYYIDKKLAAIMVYYTHAINDLHSNLSYSYLKTRHNFLQQLAVNLDFRDVNATIIEYLYSPLVGRDIELLENRIDKLEELECLLLMKPKFSLQTRYDMSRINDYTNIRHDKRIQEYDNIPIHYDNVDYKNEWKKWLSNCHNNEVHRIYFMWGGETVRTELNEFCNNQNIINDMKSSEVSISSY